MVGEVTAKEQADVTMLEGYLVRTVGIEPAARGTREGVAVTLTSIDAEVVITTDTEDVAAS